MSHDLQTDEQLMLAVGRGEIGALGELYRRYQKYVFTVAYRILSRWDLAEDVCQEVFLRNTECL